MGDDPPDTQPAAQSNPDASTSTDGGGPGSDSVTGDSGSPDAGVDAPPPACTKIQVTTLAGGVAAGSDDGAGAVATFNAPEGITVDGTNGDLYVADTGGHLIRKVQANGATSTYSTKAGVSGNWIKPRRIVFSYQLFVSDEGHSQVYSLGTDGTSATTHLGWANMRGVAIQPTAFGMFVTDGVQLGKKGAVFSPPDPVSGSPPAGFLDGTAAEAKYDTIEDIAFDGDAILYVADKGNHRIRKVNAGNGAVSTFAGGAAPFDGPTALVVDQTSHVIYVADVTTIRVVTPTGDVSTLVGSTAAFADGNGCDAKFVNIKGITKFANELFVTDVNRIRKITMN